MINQEILKGGETGETVYTLSQFALRALKILQEKPRIDEVVILANAVKELKETHITPPRMTLSIASQDFGARLWES